MGTHRNCRFFDYALAKFANGITQVDSSLFGLALRCDGLGDETRVGASKRVVDSMPVARWVMAAESAAVTAMVCLAPGDR